MLTQKQDFDSAILRLKTKLVNNDLYRNGSVYITYDRVEHEFYVCENDGSGGISSDEYPSSKDYRQIVILNIEISGLDEQYKNLEKYNKEEGNDLTEKELWEAVIDMAIETAVDNQEMNSNKKAALFELDVIETGRYTSPLVEYMKENNESLGNLNLYMREKMGIIQPIRIEILDYMTSNPDFDI